MKFASDQHRKLAARRMAAHCAAPREEVPQFVAELLTSDELVAAYDATFGWCVVRGSGKSAVFVFVEKEEKVETNVEA